MHCVKTCRDARPDNPETWCDGCTQTEAEDREGNMDRYRQWRQATHIDLARLSLQVHYESALLEMTRS